MTKRHETGQNKQPPSGRPPGTRRAPSVCPSMKVKVKVKVNIYRTIPNNQPSHSSTQKPRLTPRREISSKNSGKHTQNGHPIRTQKNQPERNSRKSSKRSILKY